MFEPKLLEKLKTHILDSITFFPENRVVYEIMYKNIVELDGPHIKIWGMRIACWILKPANTLRICNIFCFSTATMVARTRLSVTLYVNGLSFITEN